MLVKKNTYVRTNCKTQIVSFGDVCVKCSHDASKMNTAHIVEVPDWLSRKSM